MVTQCHSNYSIDIKKYGTTNSISMNNLIPSVAAISLYLLSGAMLAVHLFKRGSRPDLHKPLLVSLALIALLLHSHLLYKSLFLPGGLNLGVFNAFSLVSWLIIIMLILTMLRKPVESLGVALFPLAAFAILLELLIPSEHIVNIQGTWQLQAHIIISIAAYSLISLAMFQAIVLYIQDKHLRNHRPGGVIRSLPPLQSMEYLLFQLITFGYILLTIGLIIGGLFLENMFAKHLAHKTILSIIAWVIFSVLLWGRFRYGWRGRKAIQWTLGGFTMLMLAYFGSKMVLEIIKS